MALPKQLIHSFEKIKSSQLVTGTLTAESVQTFADLINRSIPSQTNSISYSIYRFNRTKYIADRARFVNDIKLFQPYDALILWTDYQDILSFFKLDTKIFLGWDKRTNRYRAHILPSPSSPPPSDLPVQILRRGETLASVKAKEVLIPEDVDDEMEQIYDYMQQRIANLTKQVSGETTDL